MTDSNPNPVLAGRVALVTGATRGIGRSIAERLLEAGASVAICGRREADVARAVADLASSVSPDRVIGKACDVGRHQDVVALMGFVKQSLGRLDILVNNAGIGGFERVDRMTPEQWRAIIDTNLSGVFYCTREAAPLLREHGGDIVNIGSLASRNAMAGGAAYNASKFGLLGLTEASMLDLRHDNIRVSCVMPGSVATEFAGPSGARSGAPAASDWKIAPGDVADAVLHIVTMPARTHASRIEIRPTRPPK